MVFSIQIEGNKINAHKAVLDDLKSKLSTLERQRDELRGQKRILDQELLGLITGRSKLNMKKVELQHFLEEETFDRDVEEAKMNQKLKVRFFYILEYNILYGICHFI